MAGFLGGGYDPWQYTEYQVFHSLATESSLTTIVSIAGKGFLETALIYVANASSSVITELKITVDGIVIFHVTDTAALTLSRLSYRGIIKSSNVHSFYDGSTVKTLFADTLNCENVTAALTPQTCIFPSASIQSTSASYDYVIPLNNSYPFKQSLLVEAKGMSLRAIVKARY